MSLLGPEKQLRGYLMSCKCVRFLLLMQERYANPRQEDSMSSEATGRHEGAGHSRLIVSKVLRN
jgi:hypothetical protein